MLNQDIQTEINLNLWKYLTEDAAKIKDRMWTIASWMFTLQAALLAFISKHLSGNKLNSLRFENNVLVILTSIVGILLSIYTMFLIQQYGMHIRGMWNRADLVRRQTPGLSEIWFLNNENKLKEDAVAEGKEEQRLPKVALRLIYLCIGFMILFVVLLFIALFNS